MVEPLGFQLLVFSLNDQRYALRLEAVERVVRAVEVTPLPDAPECVLGIINVQGRIVPAINMRKRFRLPEKALWPSDQFIICAASQRTLALAADAVHGLVECPSQGVVAATEVLPRMEYVEGVMILADGMILISNIDMLLSIGEESVLGDQLANLGGPGDQIDGDNGRWR
jgi:purine-binding chemotaxis protein CheW